MDGESVDPVESALTDVRSTVKWLVGASGVVAAALVTGLQLSTIGEMTRWAALVSSVSAAGGIGCALALIYGATRVLTVTRVAADDLALRELNDQGALSPDPTSRPTDEDLIWIYQRRHTLLGEFPSVMALVAAAAGDQVNAASHRARVAALEAALHLKKSQDELSRGVSLSRQLAVLFLGCVLAFALAPLLDEERIDAPVGVEIAVVEPGVSPIDTACGSTRQGFVVAGSWEVPTVRVAALGSCPAQEAVDPAGTVIVPK